MVTRRFKLSKNVQTGKWEPTDEATESVLKIFRTRDQALAHRVIERTIDNNGEVMLCRIDGTVSRILMYPSRERR